MGEGKEKRRKRVGEGKERKRERGEAWKRNTKEEDVILLNRLMWHHNHYQTSE